MPKIPYKSEKSRDDSEDYEIVSFEDFCDKSPSSKTDLLTLNDNINYRLCFESDKAASYLDDGATSSRGANNQTETSLDGSKQNTFKRKLSNSFAPFGRYNGKNTRGPLFSGVLPKRTEGESSSREHRYERFADRHGAWGRACQTLRGRGAGALGVALALALCAAAYWTVCAALTDRWGEEHYKKLWERAHPDSIKKPLSPLPYEKQVVTENRYHDHNNLSTKNRNATEGVKKKELLKKSYLERTPEVLQEVCANVEDVKRFDCYPQFGADEEKCLKRGCCWRASPSPSVPYCFYPPQFDSFRFLNMTENKHGVTVYYERARPSGYPGDWALPVIEFLYLSDDVLMIKISDSENKRFEVPYPSIPMVPGPISNLKYRVVVDSSAIGFKVVRTKDNVVIVNTQDVGGLILSDKFLQLSTILPSEHIFGLGEKRDRFMMDLNWRTHTLFNSDLKPVENKPSYGTHPFYMAVEKDGNSHGMLLLNSNAMDVVLQPTPALTYRTVGGVLSLLVLSGPTPAAVTSQLVETVGRSHMPPYWGLGFHLCKFHYPTLNVTQDVWQKNRDAGLPFDVQWNDIDYMSNRNDFTYDPVNFAGLPEFVKKVHDAGMHYVVIIDPGIGVSDGNRKYPPYDRGLEMDIFVKNSTNQPVVGQVWNTGQTVFPDFTHPNATAYWLEMMSDFHKRVPYDGAWIDMNEPSNFVSGSVYGHCAPEDLPYKPVAVGPDGLRTKTLCMDHKHYAGLHYDWHSLYSITEGIATHFALSEIRGKRPFIISRSTFVGMGKYTGHWSGDISSEWHDMRMTIPELLTFSLFGIPLMGADICGFSGDASPELCKRWMQLGAFYPFARNHNSDTSKPQDPVSMGPEVLAASIKALRIRYTLLPYYYTLFWRAHLYGETVARPLFFEERQTESLYAIDNQFLIGPNLMISPILEEGATYTTAVFPKSSLWYYFNDGSQVINNEEGKVNVTEDNYVTVRGGSMFPLQEPPATGPVSTAACRSAPLQLLAAPDGDNNASGELYWDDGDSINTYEERKYTYIEFFMQSTEISSKVNWWNYGVPSLDAITVLNQQPVTTVTVDSVPCAKPNCEFTYNENTKVLKVFSLNLPLDKPFYVRWTVRNDGVYP